jgi:hypothetical protein
MGNLCNRVRKSSNKVFPLEKRLNDKKSAGILYIQFQFHAQWVLLHVLPQVVTIIKLNYITKHHAKLNYITEQNG